MVNAEKYRDLIIEIFKEEVIPDYRISQDLKEEICFKLLKFNEENYIKVNELIRDAKIIKWGVYMNSFEDMATRINGYKISCDLLREIEIALLIYEPHDFRKRVIELIKLAEVW